MSIDISDPLWTPNDAGNVAPVPDGMPTGTESNKLYDIIRAERGAMKRLYDNDHATTTATLLPTNPLVYVLNYEIPPTINDGVSFKFWAASPNSAGAFRIIINGEYYDLKSYAVDATNGNLSVGEIGTIVPAIIVYKNNRFVLENSQVINVDLLSGTINDARLPATQTGKSFTSTVRVTASTPLILNDNGTTLSFARNQENSIDIAAFQTSDPTVKNRIDLNRTGGVVTVGGSRVLTLADTGAGNGLNADLLDDRHGSFYLARENHTGTQPVSTITGLDTALNVKVSKTGDTMSGGLGIVYNAGTSAGPMLSLRNADNGQAMISFGATNRTTNLATIGQRTNGDTFIAAGGTNWEYNPNGTLWLPSGGRIAGDGNTYWPYFNDWLSNVLARSNRIRYGGIGWADVRSTGGIFDTNLAPNVLCGVTTNNGPGDNRSLVALFYRTIQQTDIWGNWYTVG
ncbi:hypothetical protein G6M86_20935 [Agrobacterium tumefaciens]|uniref:Uncharacterized protein n=1 Tax=Agrobacterium tumefaciens TaxID=358 RepID=A0AAJ4N6H3_AGRTU|nr:hypothetical protein G6M86_20935 [Agrobacterium tumefaciens]